MPLTKPNQELKRDLKEAAALLKWRTLYGKYGLKIPGNTDGNYPAME